MFDARGEMVNLTNAHQSGGALLLTEDGQTTASSRIASQNARESKSARESARDILVLVNL